MNLLKTKTVIGAILAAIGYLLGSGDFVTHTDILETVSTILEAAGGVLFAIGTRHAQAKTEQEVKNVETTVVETTK